MIILTYINNELMNKLNKYEIITIILFYCFYIKLYCK